MRAAALGVAVWLGASGCASSGVAPAGPPPGPDAHPDVTQVAPPPVQRAPIAPAPLAHQMGLMSLETSAVPAFRRSNPTYDGRGVLIAILDSGLDLGVRGFQRTSNGDRKVLDLRDFSGEGDVTLQRVRPDASGRIALRDGMSLTGLRTVRPAAVDTVWYGGVLDELPLGNAPDADLNGDGDNRDSFGVIVVRGTGTWLAFLDTDGDGSLDDESPLADYLVRGETFTFSSHHVPRGEGPVTAAINLSEEGGRPRLSVVMDNSGHGTHVAGIAAGHDMYGVRGFDGVAPGARIIALKISNNARGGVTTNGSMLRAMEYALRFARERDLPLLMNLSFGVGNANEGRAVMDSIIDAFLLANPDVFFAIAAGNDGPGTSTLGEPGSSSLAVSVGAVYPAVFANLQFDDASGDYLGWWTSRGGEIPKPDVLAPGLVYSTVPRWDTGNEIKVGTSMATPYVTGLAALLRSAMLQEGRHVTGADLAQALNVSARRLAGASHIDQGWGIPRVSVAHGWLRAGRRAARYRVEALPQPPRQVGVRPSGSDDVAPARREVNTPGSYRRSGLASSGDTVQRFRVSLVPSPAGRPEPPRTFRLSSDAPWLRVVQPRLSLDPSTGSAVVELRFDPVALSRPGRHVGLVVGVPEEDSTLGPAFVLANTIVVPESVAARTRVGSAMAVPRGTAARHYVRVPSGAGGLAVRATVPDTSYRGQLFLFEPSGRPSRSGERGDIGGEDGVSATLIVAAEDAVPGVWEVVVQAMPGRDMTYALEASVPPFRLLAVDSAGGEVGVALESVSQRDTVLQVRAEVVGVAMTWTAAIVNGAVYRRTLEVPDWAEGVVVDVEVLPEVWDRVTDLSLTLFDPDGAQIANDPMNYPFHRLATELPEDRRPGFTMTVELFPGFARPDPPGRVDARVRVRYVGEPRNASLQGAAILPLARNARVPVSLGALDLFDVPPGFGTVVMVFVGAAGAMDDDWATAGRLLFLPPFFGRTGP